MRNRAISCGAFGVAGLLAAYPLNNYLHINMAVGLLGGSIVGVMLGYAVSVVLDVFSGNVE